MKLKHLKELVANGESTILEFKRKATTPEKLAREISALANTQGGKILIGVDDDGTLLGVLSEKSELDIVDTACKFFIDPPVDYTYEFVNYYDRDIIVINIPQSKIKPHRVEFEDKEASKTIKRAYIRVGEKSVIASKEMTRLMTSQTNGEPLKLSIGDKEKRLFAYLEQYERATVKEFAKLVNISERRAERLLIRLVRAGVVQIHNDSTRDYFTLV